MDWLTKRSDEIGRKRLALGQEYPAAFPPKPLSFARAFSKLADIVNQLPPSVQPLAPPCESSHLQTKPSHHRANALTTKPSPRTAVRTPAPPNRTLPRLRDRPHRQTKPMHRRTSNCPPRKRPQRLRMGTTQIKKACDPKIAGLTLPSIIPSIAGLTLPSIMTLPSITPQNRRRTPQNPFAHNKTAVARRKTAVKRHKTAVRHHPPPSRDAKPEFSPIKTAFVS